MLNERGWNASNGVEAAVAGKSEICFVSTHGFSVLLNSASSSADVSVAPR